MVSDPQFFALVSNIQTEAKFKQKIWCYAIDCMQITAMGGGLSGKGIYQADSESPPHGVVCRSLKQQNTISIIKAIQTTYLNIWMKIVTMQTRNIGSIRSAKIKFMNFISFTLSLSHPNYKMFVEAIFGLTPLLGQPVATETMILDIQ